MHSQPLFVSYHYAYLSDFGIESSRSRKIELLIAIGRIRVSLPARGESEIPLRADIPEGEKGVKAFKVFMESERCPATKSFDTGIFVIE